MLNLSAIPWRLIALVALLVGAASFVAFVYGAGRERERLEQAAKTAEVNASAEAVNGDVSGDVATRTDNLAAENLRLTREAADARRALNAHSSIPPAPGTVGNRARIDPALARDALCRIGRVRRDAEATARNCPAD